MLFSFVFVYYSKEHEGLFYVFLWSAMLLKFLCRACYSLVAFGNMARIQDLTEKNKCEENN